MKLLFLLPFLSVLLFSSASRADPPPTEDALSRAIFRAKTGIRGDLRWRECRRIIRREDAASRAHEYARYLADEHRRDRRFQPWVAAAIIAQESSFDRCAISRPHWIELATSFNSRFGRVPGEDDIIRILRHRRLRAALGVSAFDVGLAQFRWPGTEATRSGITDPAVLIDARTSIGMLADSMRRYRRSCVHMDYFSGTHGLRNGRTIRYRVSCDDAYWVSHNTGGGWFNYRYYHNVKRWHTLLTGPFSTSDTIEVYDGRRS